MSDTLPANQQNKEAKKITRQQQKAMHLWFTQLAEALNSAGYDMRKTISPAIDILWTPYNIKNFLWRPVQQAMLGKRSTTELYSNEIDKIFDVINKTIGERTGVHVPWPSIEEIIYNEQLKNKQYV